jgi:hypothetical protein
MARREALTAVEWGLILGAALLLLGAGKGRTLSLAEMRQLAADTGFPDPDLAAAVAMAESGGKTAIVNRTGDYGLWQIHQASHPQFTTWDLLDPAYNARAALAISKKGTVWTDWVTFNKGLHLRWMPNA